MANLREREGESAMTQNTPANLEKAFEILCECARTGSRCPIASGPDAHPFLKSAHTSTLALQGKIRIEVFAHNWRVVTILVGPVRGKQTARSPYKGTGKPYQVIDTNGSAVNGKLTDHGAASRRQPWSPPRL